MILNFSMGGGGGGGSARTGKKQLSQKLKRCSPTCQVMQRYPNLPSCSLTALWSRKKGGNPHVAEFKSHTGQVEQVSLARFLKAQPEFVQISCLLFLSRCNNQRDFAACLPHAW